jgi:hypothetical protein
MTDLTGYQELHRHLSRAQGENRHSKIAAAVKRYLQVTLDKARMSSEVRGPKGERTTPCGVSRETVRLLV